MRNSVFIKNLFTKCRIHGTGDAQVVISDQEIYALIVLAITDLNWSFEKMGIEPIKLPSKNYYEISLDWFDKIGVIDVTSEKNPLGIKYLL